KIICIDFYTAFALRFTSYYIGCRSGRLQRLLRGLQQHGDITKLIRNPTRIGTVVAWLFLLGNAFMVTFGVLVSKIGILDTLRAPVGYIFTDIDGDLAFWLA